MSKKDETYSNGIPIGGYPMGETGEEIIIHKNKLGLQAVFTGTMDDISGVSLVEEDGNEKVLTNDEN